MRNKMLLAGLAALALTGAGAARASVTLEQSVMRETLVEENGRQVVKLVPAARVTPGDQVTYVLAYANGGAKQADNVVVSNPLPAELEFVDAAGASVSVDGGKSFGALAQLTVANPDGTRRAALPRDVTHVRWALAPLAPGAAGQVSYRARLK